MNLETQTQYGSLSNKQNISTPLPTDVPTTTVSLQAPDRSISPLMFRNSFETENFGLNPPEYLMFGDGTPMDSVLLQFGGLDEGLFSPLHYSDLRMSCSETEAMKLQQMHQLQLQYQQPVESVSLVSQPLHLEQSQQLPPQQTLQTLSAIPQFFASSFVSQYHQQAHPLSLQDTTEMLSQAYLSHQPLQSQPYQQPPQLPMHFHGNVFQQPSSVDFSQIRSPSFERLSSPDSVASPASDQGYFDLSSDDVSLYSSIGVDFFLSNPFGEIGFSKVPTLCDTVPTTQGHGHLRRKSSAPVLSSPLKQQFIGVISDEWDYGESDGHGCLSTKRKKRARNPMKTSTGPKSVVLHCQTPGCSVTCSSYPSLVRHSEAHKWRGKYSPVRCEACQSSLSNEFSVQRHILRSAENSNCRRMRIYSIMKSETEIESTVRFYPTRPHGKKTVGVDLEKMQAKFLNN